MCLLIGPPGVGKTLLLKRLQIYPSKTPVATEMPPATIPTVGTNLTSVTLGRRDELTLRELGGTMGPIWHNYYKETSAVIYVMDLSNRFQIAAACIQLMMMLSHPDTQGLPILLLLNKIDLPTVMSRGELESLFKLDAILSTSSQKISVMEVSARQGQGLEAVSKWILQHYKPPAVVANTP